MDFQNIRSQWAVWIMLGLVFANQALAMPLSPTSASQPHLPVPSRGCNTPPRPEKPASLVSYFTGAPEDVCPRLRQGQGALLLMGGGPDVDAAFRQRVAPHIQGGNIVVLRTAGADGYNQYLYELTQAASVETLLVETREHANSDYVAWVIQAAEAVFIAGGDQSSYVKAWQGTRLISAIEQLYQQGGVVGGTSAGHHVLSQVVYDPGEVEGAISTEVVRDYCHPSIRLSPNFLNFELLGNTLNDSHVKQRDRLGRSALFLAKLDQNSENQSSKKPARVIAVSEATSLFVTADGEGIVDGAHEVYVLRADEQTRYRQTACGKPLVVDGLLRFKLQAGDRYQLRTDQTHIQPIRMSIDGRQPAFYSPSNPY